jgi:hypothetical protein
MSGHRSKVASLLAVLAVASACGDSNAPGTYVSYHVVNASIPGPILLDDSTARGAVFITDDTGHGTPDAFVRLRSRPSLGTISPAHTHVVAGVPGTSAAFEYVWRFHPAQVNVDSQYVLVGCASNSSSRCDDTSYAAIAVYISPDTNPVVSITNNYSLAVVFGWQAITSTGTQDIPGVKQDTIPPGATRCEELVARPDSAIWFANTGVAFTAHRFDPKTRPAWVAVARPAGDWVVLVATHTTSC